MIFSLLRQNTISHLELKAVRKAGRIKLFLSRLEQILDIIPWPQIFPVSHKLDSAAPAFVHQSFLA
jgi:hypothetical protein